MLLSGCLNIAFNEDSSGSDISLSISMGIFSICILIMGITKYRKKKKKNIENEKENIMLSEEYKKRLKKYNEDIVIYRNNLEHKYNEEFIIESKNIEEKYSAEIEKYSEQLKNKNQIVDNVIDKNNDLLKKIEENLNLVNKKLTELYSNNIIFEKYRNLIAISMFYEYFASSRVFELEGRDGAYNLFESEMRQNIIIVKLSDICKNLEEIKQNQYCMYKELTGINVSLNSINQHIGDLKESVSNINENVSVIKEIDKYNLVCFKEINKNINSIKNIVIADFLFK